MERKYQIREVMDKFGITRDTIYHYEKCGLVSMERSENGYRVFDELNVQKIKKILDLRDLGLSIDEIRDFCSCESTEKRAEIMTELRQRTEEEMQQIARRLERIHSQERLIGIMPRFASGFNVDYDISLCVGCPEATIEQRKYFYVRDAVVIDVTQDGNFINVTECELFMGHFGTLPTCGRCGREKLAFRYVFRGRVIYEGEKHFQKAVNDAFAKAKLLGYKLQNTIYATKKAPVIQGKERLTFDVLIPMEL